MDIKNSGQSIVEYTLIAVLILVIVVLVAHELGPIVRDLFGSINSSLSGI